MDTVAHRDTVDTQASAVILANRDLVDQASADILAILDQAFRDIVDIVDTVDQALQDLADILAILELDRLALVVRHLPGSFQDKGSKC